MSDTRSRLEIRLLGGFSVTKDGVPLNIGSRAAQALLAYLALTAGSRHRRERLTGLLWPDSDEASARQNLRNALWALRKAVGEGYLLADKISVGFDQHAGYFLDAAALSGSVDLEEAVASYGGELLPGFYDEWVLLERERLRAEFDGQAELLVERLLADGRARDALGWAERWIAQGQAPEPAYRALMSVHHALGDQAGLASAYRRAVKALQEDLGLEPSPETQAHYERLLNEPAPPRNATVTGIAGRFRGAAEADSAMFDSEKGHSPSASAVGPPTFFAGPEEHPKQAPHVVGREPELARLAGALSDALEGRPTIRFVTGEAGRGKSSLLGEFARRAQAAHPELVVAIGQCDAFTGLGDPLLPFRDVLEMLAGDMEARWRAGSIDRGHAERLWRLMPHTVEAVTHHGPELLGGVMRRGPLLDRAARVDPSGRLAHLVESATNAGGGTGTTQAALFEAYTRVLAAVSENVPVVLLLEDLHWADASSVALLFHLARRLGSARVLVIGTLRAEELSETADAAGKAIQRLMAELARIHGPTRIDLDAGVTGRKFVDELLDTEPNHLGHDFRERLAALTEGHPLFAVELLEEMKAEGGLVRDEAGAWTIAADLTWDALPARVEGVIRTRFERLDPDLREALQVGSVEGASFTVEVVAKVLDIDARLLRRRLSNEAEKMHRLVENVELSRVGEQRLTLFRFRHDLFQRYLYGSLTGMDRAMLHEEVGVALEELYGGEAPVIAAELARHFVEGGRGDRAARYLLAAGRRSAGLYAYEEATTLLRHALELVQGEPNSPESDRLRLEALLLLGTALQGVHGYAVPEVADVFERAQLTAARLGAARDEFAAVWSLSLYHSQRAEYERAVEYGQLLLGLGEREDDDGLTLQAHHAMWFAKFCLGEFHEVIEHAGRGDALYPKSGGEDAFLRMGGHDAGVCAHLFAARSLWYLGRLDEALARSQRALEIASGLARPDSVAHAFAHAAEVSVLRGDGERAEELAVKCREIAAGAGLSFWAAWATIMRGSALVLQGRIEEGIATMHEGRAEYPGIGVAEALSLWTRLADAHAALGQLDETERCLSNASVVSEKLTAEVWHVELHRLRGVTRALAGDQEGAEKSFANALAIAHRHGVRSLELRAAISWFEATLEGGADSKDSQVARDRLAGVLRHFTSGQDTADIQRARRLLDGSP